MNRPSAAVSVAFRGGRFDESTPNLKRVAATVVVLAALVFWAAALYGIKSPFYYGHYGYHGGSYATWARGTLRHHTLLPINEPGFAPPRPGTYYIHHPVLTHQLVTLTFAVFGEHEWSVRLGALIPSFASLLLVAAIAWRWMGPAAGGLAAAVFAITPVNVWYSVNIDQGFPSIACLLAFFWFYFRWLETGRWSLACWGLAFQALAGGFEWSPYFAFPIIFAHVAWTGVRRRGRFLVFALLHPLVVLVPLAAHFLAVWKAGMMADLLAAYQNRAATMAYRPFLRTMQAYGETLFGRVLLVLMFLWLVTTLLRVAMGRGRPVDLVAMTFALALLLYVHVFKNAVATHAYRQLYGNVWAALAVADLVSTGARMTQRLVQRWGSRHAPAAGITLLGLAGTAVLIATAPIAWAGLLESRAHGGIPGWKTFNPDLRQTAFAHEVNLATRPGDVLHFHANFPSPPPYRMDWAFYYDRDLKRGALLRLLQGLPRPEQARAVVLFLPAHLTGEERRAYAELATRHPTRIINDLALLDLRTTGAATRVYSVAPGGGARPGAVHRWLHGPYPLPRLVPELSRQAVEEQTIRALLAPSGNPTSPLSRTSPASLKSPAHPSPARSALPYRRGAAAGAARKEEPKTERR